MCFAHVATSPAQHLARRSRARAKTLRIRHTLIGCLLCSSITRRRNYPWLSHFWQYLADIGSYYINKIYNSPAKWGCYQVLVMIAPEDVSNANSLVYQTWRK